MIEQRLENIAKAEGIDGVTVAYEDIQQIQSDQYVWHMRQMDAVMDLQDTMDRPPGAPPTRKRAISVKSTGR